MAQNITLLGATYSAVPAVTLPKQGGGTATFTDVTDTTATASDVASGKYFYTSAGVRTQGTSSGGGGSSMNFQCSNSQGRVSTTSYSDTGVTLTVAVAGTYDIYWTGFRSSTSSGTQGTQLYKGSSTQGSAFTSWSNHCQVCKLSGVTLAKNDVLHVYGRARSTSTYCYAANLTIIQTA